MHISPKSKLEIARYWLHPPLTSRSSVPAYLETEGSESQARLESSNQHLDGGPSKATVRTISGPLERGSCPSRGHNDAIADGMQVTLMRDFEVELGDMESAVNQKKKQEAELQMLLKRCALMNILSGRLGFYLADP